MAQWSGVLGAGNVPYLIEWSWVQTPIRFNSGCVVRVSKFDSNSVKENSSAFVHSDADRGVE